VAAAIDWLTETFGFTEHYRYGEPGGPVSGAQMFLGNAWIMLRRARPGSAAPVQVGACTQSLTVFIEDVDSHFQKRKPRALRSSKSCTKRSMGSGSTEWWTSPAAIGSFRGMSAT
jgi:uncharacterized glyoxalase superfamily protein PhnB